MREAPKSRGGGGLVLFEVFVEEFLESGGPFQAGGDGILREMEDVPAAIPGVWRLNDAAHGHSLGDKAADGGPGDTRGIGNVADTGSFVVLLRGAGQLGEDAKLVYGGVARDVFGEYRVETASEGDRFIELFGAHSERQVRLKLFFM
jgi:hypothetical protein